jgi:hypothetical protein
VREHEEFEVLVVRDELLEALQRLRQRSRRIDAVQRERRHAAQHDLGDHAQRAESHARRTEHLRVALGRAHELRAVGQHQRQLAHLGGEVAKTRAGAVRRGGDRPGDALRVDVAEVLHRQPVLAQTTAELADRDARLHAHEAARAIHLEHAAHVLERDEHAIGEDDVAEGVSRAGDAHAQIRLTRLYERVRQLLHRLRAAQRRGGAGLVAGPVAPPCSRRGWIVRLAHR